VTGESGFAERNPKNPRDTAATRLSADELDFLRESERKIQAVLEVIDEAEQTPDLLELNMANVGGLDSPLDGNIVPLAEYLYSVSRICRNIVRSIAMSLREAGWDEEGEIRFLRAFRKLVDRWTTYHRVLNDLNEASWGGTPSPDQVLQGLEKPRRAYIDALDAYHVQLQVVLNYL
jgi:hypothetical protein